MAPMDSLPNKFLRTAACWTLSSLLMLSRTIRMVPLASFCMLAATWVESRPSSSKAALCFLVADSPAVSPRIRFLMPVAATSEAIPEPTMLAPMAAISPEATPPTEPSGPIRVTTSAIAGAVAAVLLPR